jgi:hypothetical protein
MSKFVLDQLESNPISPDCYVTFALLCRHRKPKKVAKILSMDVVDVYEAYEYIEKRVGRKLLERDEFGNHTFTQAALDLQFFINRATANKTHLLLGQVEAEFWYKNPHLIRPDYLS